jgi:acetyl-CoA carboxylase carboxyl transferase subunit beta
MSWIDKILSPIANSEAKDRKVSVSEGLWQKCVKCEAVLYRPNLERNLDVCPECDHHMRIGARRRIDVFLDREGREEVCTEVEPVDRLKFKDLKQYKDHLTQAQKGTGEKDALIAYEGRVLGLPLVAVAFEFNFHAGSMGYTDGEKLTHAANICLQKGILSSVFPPKVINLNWPTSD